MQIPRTGIILAYMAALAQAGPFTEDQAAFDARADFRVQLCKASGQCTNMRYTQGQCKNLGGGWNDKVSSVDTYNHSCIFYANRNCGGITVAITGKQNIDGPLKGKISAVKCN